MHDGGKIIAGLVLFLAIVTSPIWYHQASGTVPTVPDPKIITEAEFCVAPTPYMKAFHMDLLNQWRDDVVRTGERIFQGPDGKEYEKSLSRTCMNCHSNKAEFCDRCHDYTGVTAYCWDCHVEPREGM
ncbi:MAG: sulfate reduction electron transfer complex DsrMKJOP subunit DsrJ [Planctomycetota bacterium]